MPNLRRYRDNSDNLTPSPRLGCVLFNQNQLSQAQQACFISCNSVLTCSYVESLQTVAALLLLSLLLLLFEPQTVAATQPVIWVAGRSFTPAGAVCSVPFRKDPSGQSQFNTHQFKANCCTVAELLPSCQLPHCTHCSLCRCWCGHCRPAKWQLLHHFPAVHRPVRHHQAAAVR
jgi:hypothetical protein